jgi:hypothetical protein
MLVVMTHDPESPFLLKSLPQGGNGTKSMKKLTLDAILAWGKKWVRSE